MWSNICILVTLVVICDSARILAVIPTPSISHQVVFRPIALELAKRGHDVVVITTDPMFNKGEAPVNYTEIDVHNISYDLWNKFVDTSSNNSDLIEQVKIGLEQINLIFKEQLLSSEVQKLIKNKEQKFDLLFAESWVMMTLAYSHIFKVPTIQFSSLGPLPGMYEAIGAPTHVTLYPLPLRRKIRNMSIWEKISEYYFSYSLEKVYAESEASINRNLKEIIDINFPTLSELRKNIDMVFVNVNPIWDFNRPVPPNVIYLGGLHQKAPKMLPQDLKSYLDSATNGVIYMSLGTNVKPSNLPRETIKVILKVFGNLSYNVLWKWDQDVLEGRPNNVNISKWLPQSDLLRHPNIKLFITQGGLQSTDESITAGVPLVGIPMLADQWFNTDMYVHHKIGVKLDIETLTEEVLRNAINTVLNDDSYRNNILRLGNLMRDQPQTPLERAIWWTEYTLRHGGAKHLRSPAANITWAEYLELKMVAVVLMALLVLLTLLVIVIRFLMRIVVPYSKLKMN